MEPSDYPVPVFKAADLDALADAELRLTGEVLEYARHASTGRVHFSRISNDIGPTYAQAIIAERQRRGGFTSVNDLRSVRGIGDKRFAELAPLVTV